MHWYASPFFIRQKQSAFGIGCQLRLFPEPIIQKNEIVFSIATVHSMKRSRNVLKINISEVFCSLWVALLPHWPDWKQAQWMNTGTIDDQVHAA